MHDYHPHLNLGVTNDWWGMVDSTIDEARALREQSGEELVGVGHSAGGALIACAATKSPELFEKVVLVDSPMFNPLKVRGGGGECSGPIQRAEAANRDSEPKQRAVAALRCDLIPIEYH